MSKHIGVRQKSWESVIDGMCGGAYEKLANRIWGQAAFDFRRLMDMGVIYRNGIWRINKKMFPSTRIPCFLNHYRHPSDVQELIDFITADEHGLDATLDAAESAVKGPELRYNLHRYAEEHGYVKEGG